MPKLKIGGIDINNLHVNGRKMKKVYVNRKVVFEAFQTWNTFSPGESTVSGNFRVPNIKIHSTHSAVAGVPNAVQGHDVAQALVRISTTPNSSGSTAIGQLFIQFRGQPSMTTDTAKFLNDHLAGLIVRVYATDNPSKQVDIPVRQLIRPATKFKVLGIDAVRLEFTAHSDTDSETYALGGMIRAGDSIRRSFPTGTPTSVKILYP